MKENQSAAAAKQARLAEQYDALGRVASVHARASVALAAVKGRAGPLQGVGGLKL